MPNPSATIGGALKVEIESAGLGLAAYRDRPPPAAVMPYAVILESIAATIPMLGDTDDPDRDESIREEVQVDIWQAKRNPKTGANTEVYNLGDRLAYVLHGSRVPTSPSQVYGMRVLESRRVPDPNGNLIHHVITLIIDRRSLGAQTVPA